MVEIIYGRSHSGCENALLERIKASAEDKQRKTLVLVPDQYSFEFDKRLYEYLGARLFNSIETNGITRLCEQLCRTYGGNNLAIADNNTKYIAMYKAQSQLRREGFDGYHKKSLLKPYFVSECISLFSEFKRAGATVEIIRLAAEKSPTAVAKLQSIAAVYERYNNVLEEMGYKDSVSDTVLAAKIAKENKCFENTDVFFESFSDFSIDELKLVERIIAQSKSCTFTLLTDETKNAQNPFSKTIRTKSAIERLANDHNLKPKFTNCKDCTQSIPLKHINYHYGDYKIYKADSDGMVKTVCASDAYEEIEYICSEINRLVRTENYKYNDIAVLSANLSQTSQIFSSVAERYDIPYFTDESKSALISVPAKYLMNVLDAVLTKEYRTENILRIVKSPLSPILEYDACDLEDYCTVWKVDGKMWEEPFLITEGRSDRVEQTRQKIIAPLDKFKKTVKDKTADKICQSLFTLLDELQMSEKVYSAVRLASGENETDLEVRRSLKQVWLGMITAIKSIFENMPGEEMSLRAFSELITLMLQSIKISAPPQKADCVRVGQTEHSRLSDVKALFIMQVNDGVFPSGAKLNGLLGENELNALEGQGASLDRKPAIQLDNERFEIYSALTLPTKKLYLSYSLADRKGSHTDRSPLVTQIEELFSDDIFIRVNELDREFFCTSFKTAFHEHLAHSRDETLSESNILTSLQTNEYYSKRICELKEAAKQKSDTLSEETAKKLFFPNDMNLSATRVSDYYNCPFNYFCKHGLKLSTVEPLEINNQNIGTIVHACLEYVMSRVNEHGVRVYDETFSNLSDEELRARINRCTDRFVEEKMGGKYGKTKKFYFELAGLKSAILMMAINFREEMKQSKFIPVAFEYNLTNEKGESIFTVNAANGVKLNLRGQVDRADIYRTDSGNWLRIIDYKTGNQKFKEEEVYHGLDLQMLLYLLAMTTGSAAGEELLPAGIMYSHVKLIPSKLSPAKIKKFEDDGTLYEELVKEHTKQYKPDGEMLFDEIKDGINPMDNYIYTIFTTTKSGFKANTPLPSTLDRIKALEEFALRKVIEMANKLHDGNITPHAIDKGNDKTSCTYCNFKGLCKKPNPKKMSTISAADKELLNHELDQIINENNQRL